MKFNISEIQEINEYEEDYINFIMDREKCNCGKNADWMYMPSEREFSNPFYCNDCVPRGCSCNYEQVSMTVNGTEYLSPPDIKSILYIDGMDTDEKLSYYVWLNNDHTWWEPVDHLGRSYPCCEFMDITVQQSP